MSIHESLRMEIDSTNRSDEPKSESEMKKENHFLCGIGFLACHWPSSLITLRVQWNQPTKPNNRTCVKLARSKLSYRRASEKKFSSLSRKESILTLLCKNSWRNIPRRKTLLIKTINKFFLGIRCYSGINTLYQYTQQAITRFEFQSSFYSYRFAVVCVFLICMLYAEVLEEFHFLASTHFGCVMVFFIAQKVSVELIVWSCLWLQPSNDSAKLYDSTRLQNHLHQNVHRLAAITHNDNVIFGNWFGLD